MARTTSRTLVTMALFAQGVTWSWAQIPEKFTNLQVLPKDSSRAQLVESMRGFAIALEVRCTYCHSGGNTNTLEGVDFASDDKWEKRTARAMLRMVNALNAEHISHLEPRPLRAGEKALPALRVECATCHHSVTRPETIGKILSRGLEEQGPEGALRTYRELRAKYLDRGSYDFGDGPLNMIGEDLLRAHRWREALPLLEYDVETHPDASWSLYLLGEARLAGGDSVNALAAFKKSLTLDPENGRARKKVQELEQSASPKP